MMEETDAENRMANTAAAAGGALKPGFSPHEAHYDELDRERDELDVEGIDDMNEFLKDVQANLRDNGSDKSRIKTLEKSLEDEKRRLAGMEMQLREAKRQRDAENQMVVVTKQSQMLENMMHALSQAAQKEVGDRMHWEAEWRQRFSEFHGQHREMEEALKRKHVQELKAVKDEIQRNIRRVANEVQRTKGKRMPSPRTMAQMQEDNMGRILILFHKHGQERMTLASKVSKQEEMLVHTKNQSLQKMMGQSQMKSSKLHSKVLPAVKTGKRFELAEDDDMAGSHATSRHESSLSRTATREQTARSSRASGHGGTNGASRGGGGAHDRSLSSSWSARNSAPLPSPRIDYQNITFLTGIEDEYEHAQNQKGYTRPSKSMGAGGGRGGGTVAADSGHDGLEQSLPPSGGPLVSAGATGSLLGTQQDPHVGPKSYFKNPENAQFAKGIPDPASYRGGGPAHLAGGAPGEYMTNPNVGQEFAGWAPPQPPPEDGKPDWNEGGLTHGFPQLPPTTAMSAQQWHPNIISFDRSTTGHGSMQTKKAGAASPYLASQPLSKKAKAGSAAGRNTQRSHSVAGNSSRLSTRVGTMPNSRAAGSLPPAAQKRAKSTEPTSGVQASGRFPKIADSGRQQATDQNLNRPYTELGKNDDFSLMQSQKIGKLENWIEDKIKGVLGNSASRDNILDRLATASSFGDRASTAVLSTRGHTAVSQQQQSTEYDSPMRTQAGEEGAHVARTTSTASMPRAASSRSDGGAVDGLLSKLKTRLEDDPKTAQAMSQNRGFGIEGRDDKVARQREYEASRRGVPIDQDFEGQDIDNSGRFDRDGNRVQMTASDDMHDRRNLFDALNDDRSKTPKRVGFKISPRDSTEDSAGVDGGASRGEFSRPGSMSGVSDMMSDLESSRPATGISEATSLGASRPGTSASSYISEDPEEDTVRQPGEAMEVTAERKAQFFSLIRHNKVPEVEDQLNKGFPIDARDAHGNTPLMVAAQNGHKRLCKLTLKFGAEPNSTNHQVCHVGQGGDADRDATWQKTATADRYPCLLACQCCRRHIYISIYLYI